MHRSGMVTLLLLMALLAACGRTAADGVAATAASTTSEQVRTGVLAGDARLETGCVWLDTDDGRLQVLWPEGYRASADPLEVRDPTGAVVATAGDELRISGRPASGQVTSCQTGELWRAVAVEPAS